MKSSEKRHYYKSLNINVLFSLLFSLFLLFLGFLTCLYHELRQRMLNFASENKIIKVKQKMVAFLMLSATTTSKGLPRACSDARAGFLRENKLSKNI